MINKQQAIKELQQQISSIEPLKHNKRFSPEFTRWRRDTQIAIEHIFGKDRQHLNDFNNINYNLGRYSSSIPDSEYQKAFDDGLDNTRAILKSMINEITKYGIGEDNQSPLNAIAIIENLCKRFHRVARQLQGRHNNRSTIEIEDEYDVQNLLHGLLTLYFDDIRPEEWTPSYAGSSSRMDFLLKKEQIVIETKKTRKGLGSKEIGEQLIIDIQKYQAHPDCKTLICFVYDPEEKIPNPKGIENDLNRIEGSLIVNVKLK